MNPNSNNIPLATETQEELRDIQGYQAIIIPDYVWWILGTIALLIVALLIYKFVILRKKETELSLYEKTLRKLEALDLAVDSKSFYLEYSDIVRAYLLERVELNLFDKTLNELRFLLEKVDVFDAQSRTQLLNIFAKADMAKFARQDVSAEKRQEHLDKTKEILAKLEKKLTADEQKEAKPDLGEVDMGLDEQNNDREKVEA